MEQIGLATAIYKHNVSSDNTANIATICQFYDNEAKRVFRLAFLFHT